ncbi:MAG TPA: crossover junction endodeoxyribonuclease RuvC [Candidatus Omnitrophota bacterium]|nr:crossover junction endodeoxyribonuclease RuvC [Candidatus Omnitrophota bacterium]
MRVLGVDPGTWRTGVGILDFEKGACNPVHYEVLWLQGKSKKDYQELSKRLRKIHDSLTEVFKIYKPDVMALEDVFYGQDFKAAVRIGEARAVAILAATEFDVRVSEYSPTQVKSAVCGNGRASKIQIQYMVRHLLKLRENPPADAADALAVAICHCHSSKYVQLSTGNSR